MNDVFTMLDTIIGESLSKLKQIDHILVSNKALISIEQARDTNALVNFSGDGLRYRGFRVETDNSVHDIKLVLK